MSDGIGATLPTAGLARRLASFAYEGVLLFGVLMAAGFVHAGVTHQEQAMRDRHGLQAFLFVTLAVYFGWLWSHGGQTVAMRAWRIRLLRADGTQLGMARALARFALSWLWFAPALLALWLLGVASLAAMLATLAAGVAGYAALTWLHPDRQFLHDAVCGTRLVSWRAPA